MSKNWDELIPSLNRSGIGSMPDAPDVEIAYYLQNSQPGDTDIVGILVKTYAEEIKWLIQFVLFEQLGRKPEPEIVRSILVQTFVHAVCNADKFWGEASVRNWLFAQAINTVRSYKTGRVKFQPFIKFEKEDPVIKNTSGQSKHTDSIENDYLKNTLKKHPLIILMRYVLRLEVSDIANILSMKPDRIHGRLTEHRNTLLMNSLYRVDDQKSAELISRSYDAHKLYRAYVHKHLDSLLEKNSKDEILLREHLSICDDCRYYVEDLNHNLVYFSNIIEENWPKPRLSVDQFNALTHTINNELSNSRSGGSLIQPLRKGIWMLAVILLFAFGAFALIQITPERGEFPPAPTPTQRYLPTPITTNIRTEIEEGDGDESLIGIYAFEPKLSSDGRWLVFSSNASLTGDRSLQNSLDILLYDTQFQIIERIIPEIMPFDDPFTSLDISADGSWIVYNGFAGLPEDDINPCKTISENNCIDIFLYDRMNSSPSRITHSIDGGPANGSSIMPSISENGRWVVFWSTASNLLEDESEWCQGEEGGATCAEIYIYDRMGDRLERVPIGRYTTYETGLPNALGALDISDDGRWILLSIEKSDRIADRLGGIDHSDVYLYDREENVFEAINVASDGSSGNGVVSYAQMTPDSRYIVFTSSSSNLVPDDQNEFGDVFLRDRLNDETEIISRALDGSSADGDSDINWGIWGNNAITNDGRFVVFISSASNLDPDSPDACSYTDNNPCISIYLYDRINGSMERITKPLEDHFALFPSISTDGRWISYSDVSYNCPDVAEVCIDATVYDRERDWESDVTHNLFPKTDVAWKLESNFEANSNPSDIEFSPNGDLLAVIGANNSVEVIDVVDDRYLLTLNGSTSASILSISFSPDGRYITGGSEDGIVNIWRTSDGSLAYLLENHPGSIIDIQFSPNGEYLYAVTRKAVWTWRITERKFTRTNTLDFGDVYIKGVDISPSNDLMAVRPTSESLVWIQRLPGGDVIHRLAGDGTNLSSAAFSPDGEYLIVQYYDGFTQIWHLAVDALGSLTPKLLRQINLPSLTSTVEFSADGNYAAVGSANNGVQMLEIPDGKIFTLPDSSDIGYISNVDLSLLGNFLAAATHDAVYIWRNKSFIDHAEFFRIVSTDEFIQIPNRRRPFQNAEMQLNLDRIAAEGLTLYQANDQTSFEIFAPLKLPANISFVDSSLMQDGSILIHYQQSRSFDGVPAADLYFHQELITDEIQPLRIGESGTIKMVEINGRRAEYVKGDWLSIPPQKSYNTKYQDLMNLHWTWSSEVDVQQLRWRYLNLLLSLTYIPRQSTDSADLNESAESYDRSAQQLHLKEEELIEIAGGISNVDRALKQERILIEYIVKPGDTCTTIAYKYGTTVGTIVSINNLVDYCELITIDQKLLVPLPVERIPLTEDDLDCDGTMERLQIVPTPLNYDSNISYGITLETQSDIGIYKKKWQYTIAEVEAEYLVRSQLIPVMGCQQLLAVNVMGSNQENQSGLVVFKWDHEIMDSVFSADGLLQSVTSHQGVPSLSTLELEFLPGTSSCNRLTVIYIWDGETFTETARFLEENSSCGLR